MAPLGLRHSFPLMSGVLGWADRSQLILSPNIVLSRRSSLCPRSLLLPEDRSHPMTDLGVRRKGPVASLQSQTSLQDHLGSRAVPVGLVGAFVVSGWQFRYFLCPTRPLSPHHGRGPEEHTLVSFWHASLPLRFGAEEPTSKATVPHVWFVGFDSS